MMELTHAIATMTARQRTADVARSALPDAPTIPEPERPTRSTSEPAANLRHGVSAALRRLADRLDPSPADRTPAAGEAL